MAIPLHPKPHIYRWNGEWHVGGIGQPELERWETQEAFLWCQMRNPTPDREQLDAAVKKAVEWLQSKAGLRELKKRQQWAEQVSAELRATRNVSLETLHRPFTI